MHHHPLRRARLGAAITLLLALLATACGSSGSPTATAAADDAPATTPASVDLRGVTLRVGDLSKTGRAALEAAGEADTPYKIEWSAFPAGPPAIEALNAGAIDVSTMGDTPSIFAQAGKVDTKIVAVAHPATPKQTYLQLLVPEDSDIKTIADLEGKKVAVSKQTILQYFLLRAFEKAGLDLEQDVKPAYLAPLDAIEAYKNGDVDAVVGIEPLTTVTKAARPSRVIADSADYFVSQTVTVARGGALKDPKLSAAIGDYLQRLVRVNRWTKANVDEWAAIYAKATQFPPNLAKPTLSATWQTYRPIDDQVVRIQQQQIDAFAEAGLVPAGLKASDEFDTRFNALIEEAST